MAQPIYNSDDPTKILYGRGAQLFWVKGHSVLLLVHSKPEDKIMIRTFESQVSKTDYFYLTSQFDAYGLMLMLSELVLIVIISKIVYSSMKFKFVHNIVVIQKKFSSIF